MLTVALKTSGMKLQLLFTRSLFGCEVKSRSFLDKMYGTVPQGSSIDEFDETEMILSNDR